MDNPEKSSVARPVTAVEFCAGYAGIHLGLARAIGGLRLIVVSEIEAFAAANLVAKMEAGLLDPAPVWPDLKTFPNRAFHGKVDVLVAGFPCQPFSAAGKRGGTEDPRHLFPYIKQSCIDMQPRRIFLENVEGIISSKLKGDGWADPEGTSVLLHVLRELERVGYRATAGVFSAAEVGAPHQRKRVFIYGQLADSDQQGLQGRNCGELRECAEQRVARQGDSQTWPSRPGEEQYDWEPPRVVDAQDPKRGRSSGEGDSRRRSEETRRPDGNLPRIKETQPPVGRDADGLTDWLDYAELYSTCDNRTDELRLLGNGVVPPTAERAWRVLQGRLAHPESQ